MKLARLFEALAYVSGMLAATGLLPWKKRPYAVWALLRESRHRVVSILSGESYVEFDARHAADCPCEDDLPAHFRCRACPRRLLEAAQL